MKRAKKFSKLDLNAAFHQLELDESCRYITAFRTENKIKQYKRLIFGANSAAEELQHTLGTLLSDIPGALNIADDILIFAKNTKNHDEILTTVFKRLAEKGLTLNLPKCIFDKPTIEFYGYEFSSEGMKPSTSKIADLQNADRPNDVKSVRSFLGMTNYLKRFILNYSTVTYPLRQLTKQNVPFDWTEKCEEAFQHLKTCLSTKSCIDYFDEKKDLVLFCDASPVGISSILLQKTKGKNDVSVITYS